MNDSAKGCFGFDEMHVEAKQKIRRKGGASVPPEKRAFSSKPGLAAAAGRKGGARKKDYVLRTEFEARIEALRAELKA